MVRQELGAKLNAAINAVYALRDAWGHAQARKAGIAEAFTALQQARADQLTAQHLYDQHVREHQCLTAAMQRTAKAGGT